MRVYLELVIDFCVLRLLFTRISEEPRKGRGDPDFPSFSWQLEIRPLHTFIAFPAYLRLCLCHLCTDQLLSILRGLIVALLHLI